MWINNPPIPSDSLEGIVKEPIVIEGINNKHKAHKNFEIISRSKPPVLIIKKEDYYLPILMQDKHSGLIIGLYKVLNDLIGLPGLLFKFWHFIAGLLQIFLLSKLLSKRYQSGVIATLSTIIFAVHPLTVFDYGFFITESYTLIIFLIVLNLLQSPNKTSGLKLGALLALGFWSRVNFIWLAFSALGEFLKLSKKKLSALIISGFLFTAPYLGIINYDRLFGEVGGVYGERFEPLQNLSHFISLFFSTEESMSFLWSNHFYRNIGLNNGLNFLMDPLFIATISLVLLWSIFERGKSLYEFKKEALSLLLFFMAMIISLGGLSTYANYIYPIRIWSALFFSIVLLNMYQRGNRGKVFCFVLTVCLSLSTFNTYKSYTSKGPVIWHNMSITNEVLSHVKGRKNLFVLGEGDIGKLEYLSNNKVRPKHLYYEISEGKYKTFLDLLDKKVEGSIAIPMIDEWSGWYWSWGGINSQDILDQSKYYGVEISNQAWVMKDKEKIFWIFDFKKSQRN